MKPSCVGSRREFLKSALVLGGAVAALRTGDPALAGTLAPGQLPTIKLGRLEVSRLILGSNPFFGFAKTRDEIAENTALTRRLSLG